MVEKQKGEPGRNINSVRPKRFTNNMRKVAKDVVKNAKSEKCHLGIGKPKIILWCLKKDEEGELTYGRHPR